MWNCIWLCLLLMTLLLPRPPRHRNHHQNLHRLIRSTRRWGLKVWHQDPEIRKKWFKNSILTLTAKSENDTFVLFHAFCLHSTKQRVFIQGTLLLPLNELYLLMYVGQTRYHLSLKRHSKHSQQTIVATTLPSWVPEIRWLHSMHCWKCTTCSAHSLQVTARGNYNPKVIYGFFPLVVFFVVLIILINGHYFSSFAQSNYWMPVDCILYRLSFYTISNFNEKL